MFKFKLLYILILVYLYTNIGYGSNCSFGLCEVDPTLQTENGNNVGLVIVNVIKYLLGFLGLVSVIFVFKGGFSILTAADDEEKVKSGRKTILYSLLGIFIIIIAWVIVDGTLGILQKK